MYGENEMNYMNRFDGKGEIYAKARPKYAAGLFEYLKDTLNVAADSIFADVGSGTGIFTEQLLDCKYKVFAVEPNADMRKKAEEKLSGNKNFVSVNGNDGNIGVPDNSVDFVTAAQSFHWFNGDAFKGECKRILKPGGKVILVYNSRDVTAECTKALVSLRRKYNPEFNGFSNGISAQRCLSFFAGECDIFRTDNTQFYDRPGYINRVLSSSYSLKDDDDGYPEYIKEIGEIFDAFSVNGIIAVPTETIAYIGKI